MRLAEIERPKTEGRRPKAELVSVCMICRREIGGGHQPRGAALGAARNHSHGICAECAPGYCERLGLGAGETARVLGHLHD